MAIFPEPREDLIAEATAMPERGEFRLAPDAPLMFVGFRRSGAASLYFDQDPVLHFNAQQRLRRLFCEGQQWIAQGGHLVRRNRSGPGGRVTNMDLPVSAAEEAAVLDDLSRRLQQCSQVLAGGAVVWGRTTVPAETLQKRLESVLEINTPKILVADDLSL